MSIIVGLTGPTGAGKSSVTFVCEQMGIKVINCDLLARKVTEKGTSGLFALVDTFGKEILNEDKTLNRKKLASIAFSSYEQTNLLNNVIFPFIKERVLEEINTEKVLLDAPTLFESGIDSICNKTVAILANKDIRLSRIICRDNISKEDALLRISAGKNDDFYKKNADYIVYNNDDEEKFLLEIKALLSKLFGGKTNG